MRHSLRELGERRGVLFLGDDELDAYFAEEATFNVEIGPGVVGEEGFGHATGFRVQEQGLGFRRRGQLRRHREFVEEALL